MPTPFYPTSRFSTQYYYKQYPAIKNPDVKNTENHDPTNCAKMLVLGELEERNAAKIILKNDKDIHGKIIHRFVVKAKNTYGVETSGTLSAQTLLDRRTLQSVGVLELDLPGCELTRELINQLVDAIRYAPTLEKVSLNFGFPAISIFPVPFFEEINPDIAAVFDALKSSVHLTDLTIELRKTKDFLYEKGRVFSALSRLIKSLPNLKNLSIDITSNSCTSDELFDIVHSLIRAPKLESLDLFLRASSLLDEEGTKNIVRLIAKLVNLKSLNLDISLNKNFEKSQLISALYSLPYLKKLAVNADFTFDEAALKEIAHEVSIINTRNSSTGDVAA